MRVSIAMCTYNGERFLPAQLASIGAQTLQPSELIICDDGSTDATEAIVERFATRAGFPVRWNRNQRRLGSTKNFERAVGLCSCELIALSDQDDVWAREKLERAETVLGAQPDVGAVFSNAQLIGETNEALSLVLWDRVRFNEHDQRDFSRDQNLFLMRRALVTGATMVLRSSLLPALMPFPAELFHDDWMALALSAVSQLKPIHELLIDYRLHGAQQVGLDVPSFRSAMQYDRKQRLAYQEKIMRRLSIAAERLASLPRARRGVRYARERVVYMDSRSRLIQQHRLARLFTGIPVIPGHFRFAGGILSYFRDLLHE